MKVLANSKKVLIRLTKTDANGTTEKLLLRTCQPTNAGDPNSNANFSDALKTQTKPNMENGLA